MGTGWAVGSSLSYEFAAGNVPLLTENIVPVFPCWDKANDGDFAGNGLRQSGTGFASCGVAVKAEEYFLGVLAFRKKTVKGFSRNAAQGKIISFLPFMRIKADER